MTPNSSFPDPLEFRLHSHRNGSAVFELTHFFRYIHPNFPVITVPVHTLTDGASIPRPFWNIMGPFGRFFRGAVVHDHLYSKASSQTYSGITRAMADAILLQACCDLGVPWLTRRTIYRAVRTFGWACYKKS